jgi:hypothetical protein
MRWSTKVQERRSPAWIQKVDQPRDWALEHRWRLSATFANFDRDDEWPLLEAVQRTIADTNATHAVAVRQLAVDMPNELGGRETDRIRLTAAGLSYCEGAGPLLAVFVKVIREAAAAYRASDESHPAQLSGLTMKEKLGLDDRTYTKLSQLVWRETWFFGNGGGDVAGDWQFGVRAEVLLAERIQSIDAYLDVVARYRFGPPTIAAATRASLASGVGPGIRGWLVKREATVRDLLLITIIGGVIAGVVLWLLLN